MATLTVKPTDRKVFTRCGTCKTRIFRTVYTYEEQDECKVALFCLRCFQMQLLDVLYKEPNDDDGD